MDSKEAKVLAIITINYKELGCELDDLDRFIRAEIEGIEFEIPKVKILKPGQTGTNIFEHKALLLNYGFIRIPLEYARNPGRLTVIKNTSRVIRGFFYRNIGDIADEQTREEIDPDSNYGEVTPFAPVIVKTITEDQLALLNSEAQKLDVYDSAEELGLGSYLVIKTYPFEGLGAKVVKSTGKGKIQVELLNQNLRVWLNKADLVYTIYDDLDNFQN